MADKVIDILDKIREAKGQSYVDGMVDMANMLCPVKAEENKEG